MKDPQYVSMITKCPYCKQHTVKLITSKAHYGKDYGNNIYICKPCDAYVGTHGRTNIPKGTLANAELRAARVEAHNAFDQLWRSGNLSRSAAYSWLADVMNLSTDKAHIAKFSLWQCEELLKQMQLAQALWEDKHIEESKY